MSSIEVKELTPNRWDDLVALFGERGSSANGCWCMWWRVRNKDFSEGDGNRQALQQLVADGVVPGLIGYLDGKPVGWISLGPRTDYRRFAAMQSDKFQPVDDQPVWSIVCFFVAREARGKGVAQSMLSGAIDYARAHAVPRLEAYPVDVGQRVAPANVYMGTAALFEHAGFIEVARRDPARPIMRLELVK